MSVGKQGEGVGRVRGVGKVREGRLGERER